MHYVSDTPVAVSATLLPDPYGLIPAPDNDLITLSIDGTEHSVFVSGSGPGVAQVELSAIALEEGRHSATLTTLNPDRSLKDSRQLLFIVDSTPPDITLTGPLANEALPAANTPIVFHYTDSGSGVDATDNHGIKQVSINGKEVTAEMTNHAHDESGRIVIRPKHNSYPSNEIAIHLTVQDRAGNEKTITADYSVERMTTRWTECDNAYRAFRTQDANDIEIESQLPISIQPEDVYVLAVKYITLTSEGKTLVSFAKAIWEHIILESTDDSIQITKIDFNQDLYNRAVFHISPKNNESAYTTLRLVFPNGYRIEQLNSDICSQESPRDPEVISDFFVSASTFSMAKMHIPVTIFNPSGLSINIDQRDKSLVAKAVINPLSIIDLQSSWFEVNGHKYWFDYEGFSTAPAREGFNHYTVNIGNRIGEWRHLYDKTDHLSNNKKNVRHSGKKLVSFASPEIRDFIFDRQNQQLTAIINDDGTALRDLRIFLSSPGYGDIPFSFDETTGQLAAPFQLIDQIAT